MDKSSEEIFDLIVVGGGAAGFYGALQTKEINPKVKVLILEKSNKLLSKVRVSGGGRCNTTHNCFNPIELSRHYPRGEKQLQSVFKTYGAEHTVEWFNSKGAQLKVEDDGRMFPVTNSSQTIIDCFVNQTIEKGITIRMGEGVNSIMAAENEFILQCISGRAFQSKFVLIATGGSPNLESYQWIQKLGHNIIAPIPSLFTFNDANKHFTDLMGISVPKAEARIAGTKFNEVGPVLITHWGLSGPAIIKLSAWAAAYLHEQKYEFTVLVSWIGPIKEGQARNMLAEHKSTKGKQRTKANPLFQLPQRLWTRLCENAEISDEKIWAELPQKNFNKLLEQLIRCPFQIKGKTTFKEEFVTCGGVDLKEINMRTMESKLVPGLFFAGEVLNIDGETGGFNFQAAWSTSYVAAKTIGAFGSRNIKNL